MCDLKCYLAAPVASEYAWHRAWVYSIPGHISRGFSLKAQHLISTGLTAFLSFSALCFSWCSCLLHHPDWLRQGRPQAHLWGAGRGHAPLFWAAAPLHGSGDVSPVPARQERQKAKGQLGGSCSPELSPGDNMHDCSLPQLGCGQKGLAPFRAGHYLCP